MAAFAAALVLAGILTYSTSFRGVLVLDDIRAIAGNASIRSFQTAFSPPGECTVSGRPVANLSFAVNYALAPADVRDVFSLDGPPGSARGSQADAFLTNIWGYHALNLAIHLAAGLVLFGVLRRTMSTPSLAFAAALFWMVHPLHTESVTYVVQRVESLAGLFYLLTLYCAIRAHGSRAIAWSAASIGSCALGMATKEVMVTAPILVALWDWTFAPRPLDRRRKWLWVGLAATWAILALLVTTEHRAPSLDLGEGMAWRYLITQAGVVVHYLRLAIVPSPLVFLYTWPLASSAAAVAPQLLLLGVLAALSVAALARRHPLGFAGAWVFLILAPTSSVLPIVTEVAAEHRMYLPLAAIAACIIGGVAAVATRLGRLVPADAVRARRAAVLGAVVVAAGLVVSMGAATAARNQDYWSDERLWRDTVEKQPDNPRARVAYGQALLGQGRSTEAETQLREGVRLAPSDPAAHAVHGTALASQGRLDEAIAEFQSAVQWSGGRDVQALTMLSAAQAEARRFVEAAAVASTAARVAREQGRGPMADELERRAAAYRAMAQQPSLLRY
jgi:protein O-mannosyl-transferase